MIRPERHRVALFLAYTRTGHLHWQARCRDCTWRGDEHLRDDLPAREAHARADADRRAHALYPDGVHVITRLAR